MTIGIDLRCVPGDGTSGAGIAHASRELVKELLPLLQKDHTVILYATKGAAAELGRNGIGTGRNCRFSIVSNPAGSSLRKALLQMPCSVLFVPSGAIAPGIRTACVPWVHDIAIFEHPEWFPESIFKRTLTTNLFRHGVKKARAVLAVSQFTKRELEKYFKLAPESIKVTLEGGDPVLAALKGEALEVAKQAAKTKLAARGIIHPFILCLGTLEPRKNLSLLLEAWSLARPGFKRPVDLVIAGRDGWKISAFAKSLKSVRGVETVANQLHRIETPTDEHRRDLLLGADLLAIPSLYEGFGLVALEAMQAGTAVLSSDNGALPEVVGDGGVMLPPDKAEVWSQKLLELMQDAEARKRWAHLGKSRSEKMSWRNSAGIAAATLTDIKS